MPRARIHLVSATLIAAAVALAPVARAQGPQWDWPSHPRNLKVLPKTTSPDQLRDVMVGFTQSLGVRCVHCHVGEEGKPLGTFDFASDAKPEKQIARDMVKMTDDIHKDLGKMKLMPDEARVEVRCATCHHGKPRPVTLSDALMATYDRAGIDSTLAAYQALYGRYYGKDAYDFTESGLGEFAVALHKKGKTDDAIRILQQIVTQYPQSARAYAGLGQGLEAAGRKDEAMNAYRKVLELDPQNGMAKHRLDALQGGAK